MIERILDKGNLLSIIIRSDHKADGIEFFTPDDFSQQLAYMNRPKNYVVAPHVHNSVERNIHYTKEVLFIKSGKVRIDYYTDEKKYLESRLLNKGDVVLLAFGGHGLEMVEESEIIEVKQGPYASEMDKVPFESVEKDKIEVK